MTEARMIGRYALFQEIASGGMATVHLGRTMGAGGFSRPVAIKRLHAQYARDPAFVAMFLDEARLASRIFHPNVVAPLDVVSTHGELFLVMEYVRGASLSRLVRGAGGEGEIIPPRIVLAIMSNVLHGLHAAHEAKGDRGEVLDIVHRDVSPQNILVGVDGVARVLDFGVAKAAGRMQTTRDGQLKGKLSYMAPEQVKGEVVTRRTDIYSATVVMWEALTCRRLFKAENEANAIARVLAGQVTPASQLVPGLPPELDRVIARGLHIDPEQRYATAREMAGDLERVMGVAPSTEVGEFVERAAAAELSDQSVRIAQMEESSSSWSMKAMRELPPVGSEAPTISRKPEDPRSGVSSISVSQSASPVSRPQSRGKILVLVAGAVALLVVVPTIIVMSLAHGRSEITPTVVHASVAPPEVTTTKPAVTMAPASPATGTASAVPVLDVASLPKANTATPRGVGATTAAATSKGPDCNPPYTTDAKGHVHFKPQCM